MNIEPGRIINDFIEPNKRQYVIPVYQRNYEWPREQCEKLFDDIIQAYKMDRNHFCGSIVYIVTIDGAEYVLHAGDELFIPKGSVQGGSVKAGTRSIHAFGGQRVKG